MEPAVTRFFSIPELAAMLTIQLGRKEISRLMQTNHRLNEVCTPAHYRSIIAAYDHNRNTDHGSDYPTPGSTDSILHSVDSIFALSKNVHHVRELVLDLNYIVYYTNCIFAFQDLASEATGQQQPPSRRPPWLAPPDTPICRVLPIPPMTLLTNLEIHIDYYAGFELCPYYLPNAKDPRATTTYICWMIQLNPHLTHLTIFGLAFKDDRDVCLFASSIFGLERLQELLLSAYIWKETTRVRLGQNIFHSCPLSLRSLCLELREEDISIFAFEFTEEYSLQDPGELLPWEKKGEECGLTTIPRRQEPLVHLKSLDFREVEEIVPEADFLSMLQHCPNLCDLGMPNIGETKDTDQLATAIAESCPALSDLTYRDYCVDSADGALMLRTMDKLRPQQIKRLYCDEDFFTIPGLDAALLFRRHSITLYNIIMGGCQNIDSKAIQVLLVECRGLEILKLRWAGERRGLCIDLKDAIEFPWGCTRVRVLNLTVCIPEEPLHLHIGVKPFYKRPAPIALSAAEQQQFGQLEVLYRQIGKLLQAEVLCLEAVFYAPEDARPLTKLTRFNTFPAMLNLSDETTGRPGYLHHLAGLSKLRKLAGSVSAETNETKVTVGLEEAEWMHQHWPVLEFELIFPRCRYIEDVKKWLQSRCEEVAEESM